MLLRLALARCVRIPQRPFILTVPIQQLTRLRGLASLNSNENASNNHLANKQTKIREGQSPEIAHKEHCAQVFIKL